MNRNTLLYLLAGLSLTGAAAYAGGEPQDMMTMPGLTLDAPAAADNLDELDPAVRDSILEVRRLERIARITNPARESYARLRQLRFDGSDEADFYPQVMLAYTTNLQVIDSLPADPAAETSKAVLIDVRPELLEGAFYYSKQNRPEELAGFARAYIDLHTLPCMEGMEFQRDKSTYATLAYIAASSSYNNKDFDRAIKYFDQYLSTDDDRQREQVYMFLGQACLNSGQYERGVKAMSEAMVLYPTNYYMLTHGIQCCINGKRGDMLQPFLDKALLQKPDDEQLLLIQGQLYEDQNEYKNALEVFQRLDMMKPNNLSIHKHLALCYFNLGVFYYNQAIMEEEEKAAKRAKRQSNSYFNEASQRMEVIMANDPSAVKYLEALAVCYGCVDNKEKFAETNNRLRALGHRAQREMAMPSMIEFADNGGPNIGRPDVTSAGEIPSYKDFAGGYVSDGLAQWSARGTFEKLEAYNQRVTQENIAAEYERLCREAETAYLDKYAKLMRISDLNLQRYDPDHETYLITSSFGDITLPVPIKNNEAQMFESTWSSVSLRAPRFIIRNDQPYLASITFSTPNGKSYTYDADDARDYTFYDPDVDFTTIIAAKRAADREIAQTSTQSAPATKSGTITFKSDVDENIPLVKRANDNTVALIIANENYQFVAPVASALHDGEVFAEYCEKTLGIPKTRIRHYSDASLGVVQRAMADLRNMVGALNASNNDVNVIVYYAGHGMPDEATKDAFLLPVDGDAQISETCFALSRLYKELDEMNATNVMVFLDACFSGAQRGEGMLMAARGVAIKPKETQPQGNMFVLSATSGQETAMPYKAKNHGMFTYFLLKKLQESKGNATLRELSDYVIKNVREQSNAVNKKPQTPTLNASPSMQAKLSSLKLR
ncbi:MAG: tetratricopeptide repeat protein [Muribaculaceae bacterium]|nr:tetratricopeptide repeat protein [Muribaculaceae bacterium]